MKCLSIHQPWATLIMIGAKQYETRSWSTAHRGPMLIHASRRFTDFYRDLCAQEPFWTPLKNSGLKSPNDLPRGVILGVVDLVGCKQTDEVTYGNPDNPQLAFGDFRPGRYAFDVKPIVLFSDPLPYVGKLSLFEVSNDLLIPHMHRCKINPKTIMEVMRCSFSAGNQTSESKSETTSGSQSLNSTVAA